MQSGLFRFSDASIVVPGSPKYPHHWPVSRVSFLRLVPCAWLPANDRLVAAAIPEMKHHPCVQLQVEEPVITTNTWSTRLFNISQYVLS